MMTGVLPFDAEDPKDIAKLIVKEEPEYSWEEFTSLSPDLQELIKSKDLVTSRNAYKGS
jgi:hypothetical protein